MSSPPARGLRPLRTSAASARSTTTTGATVGSNSVHVQVAADPHSGRAVVVTALDNLVKGAAGQAVQNANLVLGIEETAGLPVAGVGP